MGTTQNLKSEGDVLKQIASTRGDRKAYPGHVPPPPAGQKEWELKKEKVHTQNLI